MQRTSFVFVYDEGKFTMFHTEKRVLTRREERTVAHATCDRCGHEMDEADRHSGYNNLTLLRFRAQPESRFGAGNYIEGDFCDACLFELVGRYVRVIDADQVPDSPDFFRADLPRRLYAESEVSRCMAENVRMLLKDWIHCCFDPSLPRHALGDDSHDGGPGDGSKSGA